MAGLRLFLGVTEAGSVLRARAGQLPEAAVPLWWDPGRWRQAFARGACASSVRRPYPLPGAFVVAACPQRRSRVLARRFVHSLWRRRCVGWWGGAVSPRASAPWAPSATTGRGARSTPWVPNSCGGTPDPLWAVGDWRPDEIRVITVATPEGAPTTRLAVLGCCGATDEQLRVGLLAARGGALRHLTAWPGSYTAVAQIGRRITVAGDLAGARPVFHTPWANGTAYATAALPLADLIEAQLDIGHLAALLACPETPEALGDGTPYAGVKRIPPGHALILREGSREITGYEAVASLAVAAPQTDPVSAVEGVRDALVEAVRARLTAPRHAPGAMPPDPGPVPGMGPAERRAARGAPVPGIGSDLSGGSASATLALLAAGLPGLPGTVLGHGTGAGERLLAVTFNDLSTQGREDELERARVIAANPRLHHVVVAAGEEALPYASLESGPLTDEPAPSLVVAERHRRRLAAGSADHFVGHGARQVLDAHPARLADLLMDRRRRHILRPVAALARAEGPSAHSLFVPVAVYRAARRLARTSYRTGLESAAGLLPDANRYAPDLDTPADASLAALTWSRPGPAARWLTGEALAEVAVRLQEAAIRPASVQRPGRPAPGRRSPGTRPTSGSWNRPRRSAASACTPRSSTTRSYGRPGPSPSRCASSRAPGPRSCAGSSRVRASRNCRPAGAPRPRPPRTRRAASACARLSRS